MQLFKLISLPKPLVVLCIFLQCVATLSNQTNIHTLPATEEANVPRIIKPLNNKFTYGTFSSELVSSLRKFGAVAKFRTGISLSRGVFLPPVPKSDMRQKIWTSLHIKKSDSSVARLTVMRLDNIFNESHRHRLNNSKYYLDLKWRNVQGWPQPLYVTILNQDVQIKIPPSPDYEVVYFDIKLEGLEPSPVLHKTRHIPTKLFQIFGASGEALPHVLQKTTGTFKILNPHYELILFHTDEMDEAVAKWGNGNDKVAFKGLQPVASRANIFRYLVLHRFGGVYADIKLSCVVPLDEFMPESGYIFPLELFKNKLANALILSPSNSSFLRKCLDNVLINVQQKKYGDDATYISGPGLAGDTFLNMSTAEQSELTRTVIFDKLFLLFYLAVNNQPVVIFHNSEYRRLFTSGDPCDYRTQFTEKTVYFEKPCIPTNETYQ